ncbi:MAG TPA: DUF6069 family protein [Nocardioides sp.]|nr:DUF6069 family protein [Nocardioides sp.]
MSGTARSTLSPGSRISPPRPVWLVPAASTAVAVAIWVVAAPLAGAELLVDSVVGPMEVDLASVVLGSAIGGFGAVAVGWLARRRSSSPRRHFLVATGLILALSLVGPATTALSAATALWLCSMHLAVGALAIPLVASRLPD